MNQGTVFDGVLIENDVALPPHRTGRRPLGRLRELLSALLPGQSFAIPARDGKEASSLRGNIYAIAGRMRKSGREDALFTTRTTVAPGGGLTVRVWLLTEEKAQRA